MEAICYSSTTVVTFMLSPIKALRVGVGTVGDGHELSRNARGDVMMMIYYKHATNGGTSHVIRP